MNTDSQIQEAIERYLNGSMTEEERLAFEKEMEADASLAENVKNTRYTNQAIHYASLAAIREDIGKDIKDIKYRPYSGLFKGILISAIVLGGAAIGYLMLDNEQGPGSGANHEKKTIAESSPKKQSAEKPTSEEKFPSPVLSKKETKPDQENESAYTPDKPEKDEGKEASPAQNKASKVPKDTKGNKPGSRNESGTSRNESGRNESGMSRHEAGRNKSGRNKSGIDTSKTAKDTTRRGKPTNEATANNTPSCDSTFTIHTTASCSDEATGTIHVQTPGENKYTIEVDNSKLNSTGGKFDNIAAGSHIVTVHYGNNCEFSRNVTVKGKSCPGSQSYSFNPDYGEQWEVPYKEGEQGEVVIYNRMKKVVYKSEFGSGGEHWDGTDLNGNTVPTGNYIGIMKYSDGQVEKVQITIVR